MYRTVTYKPVCVCDLLGFLVEDIHESFFDMEGEWLAVLSSIVHSHTNRSVSAIYWLLVVDIHKSIFDMGG